jgi:hypothetical protein
MRNLSPEVLREIFFLLHPDDQMECMLVSNRWRLIIEKLILHHTVVISSMNSLNEFLKKLQQSPEIATKVERLVLYLEYEFGEVDRNTLLSLLPNIKTFYSAGPDSVEQILEEKTQYPWHNKIKHISEYSPLSITYQLLSANICPNLTTLDICEFEKDILPYLKNAPSLRYLALGGYSKIYFYDLDTIHKNLPHIKILKVTDLSFDGSGFDENLKPAISVTEFSFYRVYMKNLKIRTDMLRYISKKYPNLVNLEYDVFNVLKNDDDVDYFNKYGWTPFIETLGHRLKKLCISHAGQIKNFVGALEKHTSRIDFLKVGSLPHASLQRIAMSQQTSYIQTLVLESPVFADFYWLNEFQVLKSLTLSSFGFNTRATIKINDVLDNCPLAVTSLTFDRITLSTDLNYTSLSNIESLSFVFVDLPVHIDTFISRHFPKISYLKLDNCKDIFRRIFNLAKANLSVFHYQGPFIDEESHLLVLTLSNDERRWYAPRGSRGYRYYIPFKESCGTYDFLLYPPIKSQLIDEMKAVPLLILICNSLRNAYIMK